MEGFPPVPLMYYPLKIYKRVNERLILGFKMPRNHASFEYGLTHVYVNSEYTQMDSRLYT